MTGQMRPLLGNGPSPCLDILNISIRGFQKQRYEIELRTARVQNNSNGMFGECGNILYLGLRVR